MKTYHDFITINEGGKRLPKIENMTRDEFSRYFHIGMDKRSGYKPSAWKKAVEVMDISHKMGYVVPKDFGRGKGKYTTIDDTKSIKQISDLVYNSKDRWPNENV